MKVLRMITETVVRLLVKVSMKLRWVLLVYFMSRLAAALTFTVVEGWSFLDAFWWSGVASLTIGYGDFFPETVAGKLIADGFQLFWVIYITPARPPTS